MVWEFLKKTIIRTIKIKDLTEDEFYKNFKPVTNHIDNNASFDGCMFETFGKELDYVYDMIIKNRVVTIIEGDEEEIERTFLDDNGVERSKTTTKLYFASGFHFVNRLGYLILKRPYKNEFEVKIDWNIVQLQISTTLYALLKELEMAST